MYREVHRGGPQTRAPATHIHASYCTTCGAPTLLVSHQTDHACEVFSTCLRAIGENSRPHKHVPGGAPRRPANACAGDAHARIVLYHLWSTHPPSITPNR